MYVSVLQTTNYKLQILLQKVQVDASTINNDHKNKNNAILITETIKPKDRANNRIQRYIYIYIYNTVLTRIVNLKQIRLYLKLKGLPIRVF